MHEELAWIDRYLLGEEKEVNDAFDETSPLAYGLKKAGAKRSGRLLGEVANDASGAVLTPETAEFTALPDVKVGRFEVTRAQYAAFDESYEIPEGTENWPASGITFEEAADYCKWLSEKTGRKFRLPKESEKVLGLSAVSPADKRCEYSPPPPGYTGFRVIEEKQL
jgi:hypothetical protein